MLAYARDDTHHLLHVYRRLCAELLAAHGVQGVRGVLDESAAVCLRRYEKPPFAPTPVSHGLPTHQRSSLRHGAPM